MKKVIVIDYKLFAKDVAEELDILGFEVYYITQEHIKNNDISTMIRSIKPDFLFTINFSPEIAFITTSCKITYVSWTIDPLPPSRFSILDGTDLERCLIFAHRTEDVKKFKSIGLQHSNHLLLAASRIRTISKTVLPEYQCDISFVGVTLHTEYEKLENYIKKQFSLVDFVEFEKTLYDNYSNVIQAEKVYNETKGEIPQCISSFFKNAKGEFDMPYISSLINGFYSFKHRINSVNSIENIKIYGDEFWSAISPNYKGIAEHHKELNKIYSNSRLNFDVSRFYQKSSINMRVFDSMACGGVVLTEKNTSIESIFTSDIHYVDVLHQNWRDILNDKAKLNGIKFKAYKEVNSKHRIVNRVKSIIELL